MNETFLPWALLITYACVIVFAPWRRTPLALALIVAAGGTAQAQQEEPAQDPLALSTGEPVEVEEGGVFVAETHGDWEIRCINTEEIANPCQLYQLLFDQHVESPKR